MEGEIVCGYSKMYTAGKLIVSEEKRKNNS